MLKDVEGSVVENEVVDDEGDEVYRASLGNSVTRTDWRMAFDGAQEFVFLVQQLLCFKKTNH